MAQNRQAMKKKNKKQKTKYKKNSNKKKTLTSEAPKSRRAEEEYPLQVHFLQYKRR